MAWDVSQTRSSILDDFGVFLKLKSCGHNLQPRQVVAQAGKNAQEAAVSLQGILKLLDSKRGLALKPKWTSTQQDQVVVLQVENSFFNSLLSLLDLFAGSNGGGFYF